MEGARGGMLDLAIDPKLAWALQRREAFPVDVNRAPRELLLRVPGLGTRAVDRIIVARRLGKLGLGDLAKLTASVRKLLPFIVTPDWRPGKLPDSADLRARFARSEERRVGKECVRRVDIGGRRIFNKKKNNTIKH